jgi:hypothetical protein
MISRRRVLTILSSLPMGGLIAGVLAGKGKAHALVPPLVTNSPLPAVKTATGSIYESIKVRPLINARGTVTIIGATRVLPEVQQAMDEAVLDFVQLDELMDGVGLRLNPT